MDEEEPNADTSDHGNSNAQDEKARIKALGHLSEKQLSSLIARHARIFLSLSARRRFVVHKLCQPQPSSAESRSGTSATAAAAASEDSHGSCDAARFAAFGDSYRASVLLAGPTSKLSATFTVSAVARSKASVIQEGGGENKFTEVQLEGEFAASHLLALSDAASLCKSGKSLMEYSAESDARLTASSAGSKGGRKSISISNAKKAAGIGSFLVRGGSKAGWVGEGAAGRHLLLVDPFSNFHLDPNVSETRLADVPLAAVLRSVAGLLKEFPGHGVLIQVCVLLL